MFVRLFSACALIIITAASSSAALAQSAPAAPAAPAAAPAPPRPTKEQVQNALAAANVDLRQKRKLKPMVDTYKSQMANAPDEQTKQNATQQLIASMKTVLSPAQQAAFKQSLMNQMAAH